MRTVTARSRACALIFALVLGGTAIALPMTGVHRAAALVVFQAGGVQPRPCSERQGSSPVIAAACGYTTLSFTEFKAAVDRLLDDPDRFVVYKAWEFRLGYATMSFFRKSDRARHLYSLFYATPASGEPTGSVTMNVLAF